MTRYLWIATLACVGLLLLEASALGQGQPAAPAVGPPCLRQGYIYDFQNVTGNRSLVVIDRARKRYRLNFMGVCYNLQYHLGLGFKTRGVGTLSCVAKGDQVVMRDAVGPNWCVIKDIQYQTPALDQSDAVAAAAAKKR
ncbi:MAG TPA: DUF6491 family protein [Rhizomicrobium sp.]|nr:DUF6491 family protein [Rhizomicrobium sp.]